MNKRILVVDDDLESLKLIGLMLQRRGYEIIAARAGREALAKAETEDPDLVILDIMMPELDGYQICRRLRSNPNTAHLPVLMFTAKTLVEEKEAGFRAGADDYLTKPIHPSELVSHVEALLRRFEQTRVEAGRPGRTRVIGVMGAKGGVGASTLAVNLAVAAVQNDEPAGPEDTQRRVTLVDLRAGVGTVALQLGQLPQGSSAPRWRQAIDSRGQNSIEVEVAIHTSGLRYLPASLQTEVGQPALESDTVDVVISRLRPTTDLLFLDLGSVLDKVTSRAIANCDVVIVVLEPDYLGLVLGQVLMEKIKELEIAPDDVRPVLVQRFESVAAYSRAEVEDLLGQAVAGVIEPAVDIMRLAFEQGEPVVSTYPESEIAGQYRALSRSLLA